MKTIELAGFIREMFSVDGAATSIESLRRSMDEGAGVLPGVEEVRIACLMLEMDGVLIEAGPDAYKATPEFIAENEL